MSPVETIKRESRGLRGTLVESLADPVTGAMRESDTQLIKFHGSYLQDDRDLRDERRAQKLEPAFSFMIRTRAAGRHLTPGAVAGADEIARRYAERHRCGITTRQAFQLHGVDQDRAEGDHAGDQRRADRHASPPAATSTAT